MRHSWPALVGLLLLAAALRFEGLGWGLRHTPHIDERYFVENVGWMLASRDFDHRFYEYPGLVFYLLAPVLAFFGPPHFDGRAYLAARSLVAVFGVASVGLVWVLGRRLGHARGAWLAAALVAVSPVAVHTAHNVRPDVVLETFVLLTFLALLRVGKDGKWDVYTGLGLGAAAAVKFSGALLLPAYLAQRGLAPGARLRGLLVAGTAALAAFLVFSPYSLIHWRAMTDGVRTQVSYHYLDRGGGVDFFGMVFVYVGVVGKALGAVASVLLAIGLVRVLRDARRLLALVVFPVALLAVFSTATVHHDRFLVPGLGLLALVAGLGLEVLPKHLVRGAAILAVALPALVSLEYVWALRPPSTYDRLLDAAEAEMPDGGRVVTRVPDIGFDRKRIEVLAVGQWDAAARLLGVHADRVVVPVDTAELSAFRAVRRFEPWSAVNGEGLLLLAPVAPPRYRSLTAQEVTLSASTSPQLVERMMDGETATAWRTNLAQQPGDWIEVRFAAPLTIGRVELLLGDQPRLFARNVHVLVETESKDWLRQRVVQGRPPVEEQRRGTESQLLLLEPFRTAALRLVQVGQRNRPWAVAELKISALAEAAGASRPGFAAGLESGTLPRR